MIHIDGDLNYCPFCGNSSQIHLLEIEVYYDELNGDTEYAIQCQLCGAYGPHSTNPRAGWNKRREI